MENELFLKPNIQIVNLLSFFYLNLISFHFISLNHNYLSVSFSSYYNYHSIFVLYTHTHTHTSQTILNRASVKLQCSLESSPTHLFFNNMHVEKNGGGPDSTGSRTLFCFSTFNDLLLPFVATCRCEELLTFHIFISHHCNHTIR